MNIQKLTAFISRFTLSRHIAVVLAAVAVFSCVLTYVVLTKRSTDTETVYWLLNADLVLLLLMGTIISHRVVRLFAERKRGIAGSRLHMRFVSTFALLAAAPAILMAIFSSVFLYFGIHAWFDDRVSTAVHESLEVAQAYLKEHQQVMRADVLAMANDLNRSAPELANNPQAFDAYMQTQAQLRNLPEAIVVNSNGRTLARSHFSFSLQLDTPQPKDLQAAQNGEVVLFTGDGRDRIRALVALDRYLDSYLYVSRLVDSNVLAHIQTTESAVKEYTTLQGRKGRLQVAVTLMFVAVALILLLAATWFGLVFAEQLVAPIGALIVAAERVRTGDLSARVRESANDDEIDLLGRVFNRMTRQLDAVLSGASSGVIALDAKGQITLANARAKEILGVENLRGERLVDHVPLAAELLEKPGSTQFELSVGDGPRRTLFLRVTAEQGSAGAVATIDDISALVSAQRKSAWADVARRIAHEIKNPLTPIQLSAERLKRKYLPQIQEDPENFERCTETIIRQVNDIGLMVNEFSAYARMPVATKRMENLRGICRDAILLQHHAHPDVVFNFASDEIDAKVDRAQLMQVVTNLLQNAIEAEAKEISISIELKGENVCLTVADNGQGLPDKGRDSLLEPYVTTKKKGSGLGLAIVKKIMEDHEGSVVLENNVPSGAKAIIIFPVDHA